MSEGDAPDDDATGLGDPRADARGEGEVPTDQEVNRANEYLPSAMGISALLRLPGSLKVRVRAGSYVRETIPGLGRQDKDGKWQDHWLRSFRSNPHSISIARNSGRLSPVAVRQYPVKNGDSDTPLTLHVFSRPHIGAQNPASDRIVTFTLLNNRTAQAQRPRDEECYFQCGLEIAAPAGDGCFLEYPDHFGASPDDEEQSLQLLFSHLKTFAIGHGCAANWDGGTADAVSVIRTESLPTYEIKPIVPTQIAGLDLSMLALSTPGTVLMRTELCNRRLADGSYQAWIAESRNRSTSMRPLFRRSIQEPAARRHLRECREALERIRRGIALLETDDMVAQPRFCSDESYAMLEQQFHYELASNPLEAAQVGQATRVTRWFLIVPTKSPISKSSALAGGDGRPLPALHSS